jgi:hypothetical protein
LTFTVSCFPIDNSAILPTTYSLSDRRKHAFHSEFA